MVTKMQLTKELHDLREEAKNAANMSPMYFHDIMIKINETKVKIQHLLEHKLSVVPYGDKDASK